MEYKNTILLPRTTFPMRAELPKREPFLVELWKKADIYAQLLQKRKTGKKFVLHDGPPFANGDAHIGHALNMTLKDIVLKSKNMEGFYSPFLPGWDCHGLPIEHKVMQELETTQKTDGKRDAADVRRRCEAYAQKYIAIQREQFQRLGVFGEWQNPYLTMNPAYEAEILRGLAGLIERGLVYRGMRPVLWSTGCQTALAEAEVEYQDRNDPAIYVAFPLIAVCIAAKKFPENTSLLVWTTTPWTLPANLAAAVRANMEYVLAENEGRFFIFAKSRLDAVSIASQLPFKIHRSLKGEDLIDLFYHHPFLPRESRIYAADFVTEDSGTGIVHIAPGHGYDDYQLGMKHGLDLLSPVDENGKLTAECGVPELVGKYVFAANAPIVEMLKKSGHLLATESYTHSYPHCWRSKTPIIFRCVNQWFIKVVDLCQKALDAIDKVKWEPSWGVNRIRGAVESRPDWCISRQRAWGVPIPVFYDADDQPVLRADVVRKFAEIVKKEGTNVWFTDEKMAVRLGLPSGLTKGADTLDVWIDSGFSYAAVMQKQMDYFPADLYLEGSDQHRGWFQSSLLLSIALTGEPPYREVLTNGFVVDMDGKKLSKSNAHQKPAGLMEFVGQYGADVLRLWVASQDYRDDVPFSEEIFKRVTDAYRLLRNTLRILLGNLHDFDPAAHSVPEKDWTELDTYVIRRLQEAVKAILKAYENYEFHQVYHILNRFCAVELSSLYVDVLKDRLYCDAANDPRRRAAQTAMREIAETLCKLLAPLAPFTAEEAWQNLAAKDKEWDQKEFLREPVHLAEFPKPRVIAVADNFDARWEKLLTLRSAANEQLEAMRQRKEIGKSLEAAVEIVSPDVKPQDADVLEELFIVSKVRLTTGQETKIQAQRAPGKRCARCWKYSEEIGQNTAHPELCPRCARVVTGLVSKVD
ncbi:MAG: isoleucine--tRNA ligase [bacterium]